MIEVFYFSQFQIFIKLLLAMFLGAFVGLEREYKGKEAGLRTYSLVSLGSALFTLIGVESVKILGDFGNSNFDPASRMMSSVVMGIGFIGAGAIIYRQFHVEGLTTAAGLWVMAAIGVAVGIGLYLTSILASLLTVLILGGLSKLEKAFPKKSNLPDT
jgi:putative Mg2+ transporter-C (MgtC) family protein